MVSSMKLIADDDARRTAILVHDRSFLVEAGAGSGKTAIMAGRIAMMLAEGVPPKAIAAVTYTELAASELLFRVREFVSELALYRIPPQLRVALPVGLSEAQLRKIVAAHFAIDEITCSTIHGFCQRLIKPYPVEADIDPGATLMDSNQADLAFIEIGDAWLRQELASDHGGLLAEMVLEDPNKTEALIKTILGHLRRQHAIMVEAPPSLAPLVMTFRQSVEDFIDFVGSCGVDEPDTAAIVAGFSEMSMEMTFPLANESASDLVQLLCARPHPDLCTASGDFASYRKKGKWGDAAKRAGLAKAEGERLNFAAEGYNAACCETWNALSKAVAARILADLLCLVKPVMERFRDYKRSSALLDFDDLILAARGLLRDHEDVRRALAGHFAHVLVDEFQDTDTIQTEIFWRLGGEPPVGSDGADWTSFQIRPGALFLVGDPKQAIYRFRGADVAAYLQARDIFLAQSPDIVLPISTNFRSCAPILHYVNERFQSLLSAENGQPGFSALDPFHPEREDGLCIAALDIGVADEEGKASMEQQRDAEAEAVAETCARLIGSELILDHKTGERRLCRPGDIALLAPTGSELWRYEEALEQRGIPVATQAGKGLFRRQEMQDLIAVTRILADQRDTLALGALLRGPLVGLSEEEMLDIIWKLSISEEAPDALPQLHMGINSGAITHTLARDIIEKLQSLYRRVNATTPYDLLSQAIDVLRLRPILIQRHRGQAERALANVDLYLSFSRTYAVRGLRAFAEAMTAAWTDESRAIEGRPDAQEEAVGLYTMHAAKGLEWPIVVPINTMTQIKDFDSAVTDRITGRFYCPVFGVRPTGYEEARNAEKTELNRERIRLWYVASTRARELLILPRLNVAAKRSTWISLIDLSLSELPALDIGHFTLGIGEGSPTVENTQSREVFAAEAATIDAHRRHVLWLTPSRDEGAPGSALQVEAPQILAFNNESIIEEKRSAAVQGGRERGLILHKLIEEALTGETADMRLALIARADAFIKMLGFSAAIDPAHGLAAAELADCVLRTLALPEIVALRPSLVPEFPVYASAMIETQEEAMSGIADAIAFGPDGLPEVVIDWKSDVDPSTEIIEHYRAQVSAYLDMTRTKRGLIVMMTSGVVIPIIH